MRRSIIPAFAAVLFATPALPAQDDAKAVIVKALKAHGGEEKLAKLQAGQSTNKGKIDIPGLGEVEFTQQVSYMMPDKVREEFEITVMGQKVTILTIGNGDKITLEANGQAIDTPDSVKTALKEAGHMMKVGRLVALVRDKGYEFSPIGEVKVNDKPAVGVRVSAKGQKDINLYFDKATGLLAKIEHRTVDATSGAEILEERTVLEYGKTADGLPIPKKVRVDRDGKKFLEAEADATFLEKLDDSVFKK